MKVITPELAGGFRDYLPGEMIPRNSMLEKIKEVFERFGFVPLDTPGLEREEVLTGGDPEFKKQIFRARLSDEDEKLALRFDLTVPLARVVAANREELKKPFKRYQFGRVWRGERQQAGRFREFTQLDADIVGSESVVADAEIVALMQATMRALGFAEGQFVIRVSHRKILNGLAAYAGFPEELTPPVLRALDKLDKQPWDAVAEELTDTVKVPVGAVDKLRTFIEVSQMPTFVLDDIRELLQKSQVAAEGVEELKELSKALEAFGVPRDSWRIDLSVARGLGYYTGPVFETALVVGPKLGSVFSGGRYDGLVARFGVPSVPATGASVGVDRLFLAMRELGMIKEESLTAKVLVLNFSDEAREFNIKLTGTLRENGIATELYLGSEANLKGQLTYAVSSGYRLCIIAGKEEVEKQVAQVKDLVARSQEEVPLALVVAAATRLLG